jgi:lycopene cyclase domain-containing protein
MYLAILVVSLLGLGIADWHYTLVVFDSKKPPTKTSPRLLAFLSTLVIMLVLFLLWDMSGIILGIFRTNPQYTLGLNLITPNLPIEEVLFLTLLVYVTLIVYKLAPRVPLKGVSK